MKGLFRTLAQVEEMRELDPEDEYDQAEIARQYLYATNFGTPEEIEEEIETWRDIDKLGQKALQFKPKLDRMQEEIVARQLAEQEYKKEQQAKQAKAYTDSVYNTLLAGEVGVRIAPAGRQVGAFALRLEAIALLLTRVDPTMKVKNCVHGCTHLTHRPSGAYNSGSDAG